ncbi:MAG: cellulase family glycosylhydrolase [Rubrivivax sp.]|nr:cellulase family glycosylhydrolase [Rubrivivax sp.]
MAQAPAPDLPLGPVTRDYFGLVMNRADPKQPWPSVPFGSWRLWDAYVTWAQLEPQPGQWDFARLDRLVAEAEAHDAKLLLVLAHSPPWASARPDEPSAYRPGVAAEPARIADWVSYVSTVAKRYKGRIREYEIWNEPSDRGHYTGTVAQLVTLACEARKALKAVDSGNLVVSPASAGGGRHIQYLDEFLASGGAACIDVVAHHFYVPRFGPEAMVPLIREVRQVMVRRGVEKLPLWNTETGWWIASTDGSPDSALVTKGGWRKLDADREAGAVIERAFLLARAEGVARFYWYAWSNPYGWSLTDARGMPKPATKYWLDTYDVMHGAEVLICSEAGTSQWSCNLRDAARGNVALDWRDESALVPRKGPAVRRFEADGIPRKRSIP